MKTVVIGFSPCAIILFLSHAKIGSRIECGTGVLPVFLPGFHPFARKVYPSFAFSSSSPNSRFNAAPARDPA